MPRLYTQVTRDVSLNTDCHTRFFRETAVRLCSPTCTERCTRVLHLLPPRSYACVITTLFSVVLHPNRTVHNIDLRFISNCTHNDRRTVECDTNSDEQQIPKCLTRTYAGFQGQSCSRQSSAVDTDSCTVYSDTSSANEDNSFRNHIR